MSNFWWSEFGKFVGSLDKAVCRRMVRGESLNSIDRFCCTLTPLRYLIKVFSDTRNKNIHGMITKPIVQPRQPNRPHKSLDIEPVARFLGRIANIMLSSTAGATQSLPSLLLKASLQGDKHKQATNDARMMSGSKVVGNPPDATTVQRIEMSRIDGPTENRMKLGTAVNFTWAHVA